MSFSISIYLRLGVLFIMFYMSISRKQIWITLNDEQKRYIGFHNNDGAVYSIGITLSVAWCVVGHTYVYLKAWQN